MNEKTAILLEIVSYFFVTLDLFGDSILTIDNNIENWAKIWKKKGAKEFLKAAHSDTVANPFVKFFAILFWLVTVFCMLFLPFIIVIILHSFLLHINPEINLYSTWMLILKFGILISIWGYFSTDDEAIFNIAKILWFPIHLIVVNLILILKEISILIGIKRFFLILGTVLFLISKSISWFS